MSLEQIRLSFEHEKKKKIPREAGIVDSSRALAKVRPPEIRNNVIPFAPRRAFGAVARAIVRAVSPREDGRLEPWTSSGEWQECASAGWGREGRPASRVPNFDDDICDLSLPRSSETYSPRHGHRRPRRAPFAGDSDHDEHRG